MPFPQKAEMERVAFRCEGWFSDLLKNAAAKSYRSLSEYIRWALAEQMRRDGIATEPPPEHSVGAVRRPGGPGPKENAIVTQWR